MVRPIGVNNGENNGGNDHGNNDNDNGNDNGNNDNDNGNDNDDNGDDGYGNECLLKLDILLKNLKDDKKSLKTFSESIDDKVKKN